MLADLFEIDDHTKLRRIVCSDDAAQARIDSLREEFGGNVAISLVGDLVLYDELWESPRVTAHNERAFILNTGFDTLYQLKEAHRDLRLPLYRWVVGPIGNTTHVEVWL